MSLCTLWSLELCISIEGLRHVKTGQTQEQESAAGWFIMNRKQVSGNLEKNVPVEVFYSKP